MSGRPASSRLTAPEVLAAVATTMRAAGTRWKVIEEVLGRWRVQLWRDRQSPKMKQKTRKMKHFGDCNSAAIPET